MAREAGRGNLEAECAEKMGGPLQAVLGKRPPLPPPSPQQVIIVLVIPTNTGRWREAPGEASENPELGCRQGCGWGAGPSPASAAQRPLLDALLEPLWEDPPIRVLQAPSSALRRMSSKSAFPVSTFGVLSKSPLEVAVNRIQTVPPLKGMVCVQG